MRQIHDKFLEDKIEVKQIKSLNSRGKGAEFADPVVVENVRVELVADTAKTNYGFSGNYIKGNQDSKIYIDNVKSKPHLTYNVGDRIAVEKNGITYNLEILNIVHYNETFKKRLNWDSGKGFIRLDVY